VSLEEDKKALDAVLWRYMVDLRDYAPGLMQRIEAPEDPEAQIKEHVDEVSKHNDVYRLEETMICFEDGPPVGMILLNSMLYVHRESLRCNFFTGEILGGVAELHRLAHMLSAKKCPVILSVAQGQDCFAWIALEILELRCARCGDVPEGHIANRKVDVDNLLKMDLVEITCGPAVLTKRPKHMPRPKGEISCN
jgi:hypothetical protein